MTQQRIIEQALKDIAVSDSLIEEAKKRNYSAKKKLEGIYSPASPKRASKGLSEAVISTQIAKRNSKIFK